MSRLRLGRFSVEKEGFGGKWDLEIPWIVIMGSLESSSSK